MKKYISFILILVLLFSLPITPSWATQSSESETTFPFVFDETPDDTLTMSKTDTTWENDLSDSSCIEHLIESDIILKDTSFTIDETAESFREKILSENKNINGFACDKNGNRISLSEYWQEKQVSRFDLADIAYQNKVISEPEQMTLYCDLIENRLFENITCLHGVIMCLSEYKRSDRVSDIIKDRISSIFTGTRSMSGEPLSFSAHEKTSTVETRSISTYLSTNFIIEYEEGIPESEAINVANYCESNRIKFKNILQYNYPLLENGVSRYRITLYADTTINNDADPSGATFPVNENNLTASTRMEIHDFSSLTTEAKEILTHEYFHAIQASYAWISSVYNKWFVEGTANWAAIIVQRTSITNDDHINAFLATNHSMIDFVYTNPYGTVLFPLAIHDICGRDAIKTIWEAIGTNGSNSLSNDALISVINSALIPYSQTFQSIFLQMACYNFSPSTWYNSVHPGGAAATAGWVQLTKTTTNTTSELRKTTLNSVENTTNFYISTYTNHYHKFVPDVQNQNSNLFIEVSITGTYADNGRCSIYYVTSDSQHHYYTLSKTSNNTYTIKIDQYGGDYTWCGVIVSNTGSGTTSLSYSVQYRVERGTEETVSLASNFRYYENVASIGACEYKDYYLTFSVGGNRIVQTFGTKDSYLELFDASGNRLAYNDDSGYSYNALLSYTFAANTQYRVRLTFHSTTTTGNVKLAIMSNTSPQNYEGFTTYTNPTATITGNFTRYKVNPFVIKFTTQQTITMNLLSEANTYLYIIDPRSTELVVAASNSDPTSTQGIPSLYNDNYFGGENPSNSQIIKTFTAGVPYLIIASKYMTAAAGSESFSITLS